MLPIRNPLNVIGSLKAKGYRNNDTNTNQKKAILTLEKVDFRIEKIANDKEEHYNVIMFSDHNGIKLYKSIIEG